MRKDGGPMNMNCNDFDIDSTTGEILSTGTDDMLGDFNIIGEVDLESINSDPHGH